ncbi:hypothetical protein HK098_006971 [Nowakowskiella sp. JEL0407]|nr:hypothetical protein HK098_006971 [Nowakowskiella sp. JEL0407]
MASKVNDGTEFKSPNIFNFRDAGENKTSDSELKLRQRLIFRCGTPDAADEKDIELLESLNIRTIVDLRSRTELSRSTHVPFLNHRYTRLKILPTDEELPNSTEPAIYQFDVTASIQRRVWNSLTLYSKFRFLSLYIFSEEAGLTYIVNNSEMGRLGLFGLNKMILDECRLHIAKYFEILLQKFSEGTSVLVNCSVGKDRTGLFIALLHTLLGIPQDQILRDYTRTNELLSDELKKDILRESSKFGMGEEFIGCKDETMLKTLEYLKELGGIEDYLESGGFSKESQNELRKICLE